MHYSNDYLNEQLNNATSAAKASRIMDEMKANRQREIIEQQKEEAAQQKAEQELKRNRRSTRISIAISAAALLVAIASLVITIIR